VPALACLLFVTACSLAPSGDPDGILIDLEDQWARAVQQGDVAALDTIIADDYVGTTASGQMQSKADYLADFGTGDRRVSMLTTEGLDVRIYGRVAVLTHGGHAQGESRGQPVVGAFRWTHVFVERDGRWQAVANHVTRTSAP
jgi:ketosteroid isomerase-like protein